VELAVAVTWHARPGTEERLEGILTEMGALTRAEPGCLIYQPHRSLDSPGVFFIYERFVDELYARWQARRKPGATPASCSIN